MNHRSFVASLVVLLGCFALVVLPMRAAHAADAAPAKTAPAKEAPAAKKAPAKKAPAKKMAAKKKGPRMHHYTGEVLDLDCYLEGGAHGAKHAACAAKCLSDGAPAGLLVGHRAYLLLGDKAHADAYTKVRGMAAKRVTVDGHHIWHHGLSAIVVEGVAAK